MMAHIGRSPNATLTSNHDWQRTRIRKEGYMRRSLLRWLSGAALLSCLCQPGIAADKVSLMVGGIEKQIYLPAKLADRLGYFREQGLNVELLTDPAGVNAEDVLLAGAVQGVVGFYDHTIELQARGKAVQSVVQFSLAPGEVELVSARMEKQMASPADFRGKKLGVTGLGSSTHFLTQYLTVSHGVKISEISVVPVETGDKFIAAMRNGVIDAGMTTEPTVSRMLKSGEARILVDLRSPEATVRALGGLYPAACLYMQTKWVNTHKQIVQKLANAFVKALRYIEAHDAQEIASQMPAEYYAGDRDLYIQALAHGKAMFTADGRMPASGPATVLKVLSAFDKNVQGKRIDLSQTYTMEFVSAAK
jgi:NitT/TauT family transport system substrate-binding protein